MPILLNLRDLKVGIHTENNSEVQGLLMALGVTCHLYNPNDEHDWHVVITDKASFKNISKNYTRIILSNDSLDTIEANVIAIPEELSLKSLHNSLMLVAEANGVTDLEFY